jgi:hypothetical protein
MGWAFFSPKEMGLALVLLFIAYNGVFALMLGQTIQDSVPHLMDVRVRRLGSAIASGFLWLANMATVLPFKPLDTAVGHGWAVLVFVPVQLAYIAFVLKFVPGGQGTLSIGQVLAALRHLSISAPRTLAPAPVAPAPAPVTGFLVQFSALEVAWQEVQRQQVQLIEGALEQLRLLLDEGPIERRLARLDRTLTAVNELTGVPISLPIAQPSLSLSNVSLVDGLQAFAQIQASLKEGVDGLVDLLLGKLEGLLGAGMSESIAILRELTDLLEREEGTI